MYVFIIIQGLHQGALETARMHEQKEGIRV